MPLVNDTISNLLGGVSQQAPRLRPSSAMEEQINTLDHPARGKAKRPPTEHVASLSTTPSDYSGGLVEEFHMDSDRRFQVIVSGGNVQVFDRDTGTEVPVYFPDGKNYLVGSEGFKHARDQKKMWLLNRETTIRRKDDKLSEGTPTGLLYIRQADFGTAYTVTIEGTPQSITTSTGSTSADRKLIATDKVAEKLKDALVGKFGTDYKFTKFGSTISVQRKDGSDFTLEGTDGLADRGMVVVKESVQRFSDLPLRAPNGFVVRVSGDPDSEHDDYWVQFSDRDSTGKEGIWEETARPGTETKLDPSTMPHQLAFLGAYEGPVEADRHPTPPAIETSGLDEAEISWKERGNTGGTTSEKHDTSPEGTLVDDGDYILATISSTYADQTRTLRVGYSISTEDIPLGAQVSVDLQLLDGAGTWVSQTSRIHDAGNVEHEQWLEAEATMNTTSTDIRILLTHSSTGAQAELSTYGTTAGYNLGYDDVPTHFAYTATHLVFDEDGVFPVGWEITATVDGTAHTYTVEGTNDSAGDVAEGLAALITATTGISATAEGPVCKITRSDGTQPTVTVDLTWDPSTHIYSADFDLALDEYAGKLLVNNTTGAEGTISSTIGGLVVVSGLTGGTRTTVRKGDEVEIQDTGDYFMFREAPWKPREAGDDSLTPFPSFVGWKGRDIFIHEGRLGITAGDSVVMSQAGAKTNFFRQSSRLLLDSDRIDVASAGSRVAEFHTAMVWNEELLLWTDQGVYHLDAHPLLSPKTVTLELKGIWPNDPSCPPVVDGSRFFYVQKTRKGTRVMHGMLGENLVVAQEDVTQETPTYIKGTPKRLAVDTNMGLLTCLTDQGLYVYTYQFHPEYGRVMSSWGSWTLPYTVIDATLDEGLISLVVEASDGAVYSEAIDLSMDTEARKFDQMDRNVVGTTAAETIATVAYSGVLHLPYKVPVGDRTDFVVYRTDTGEKLTPTWIDDDTFDVGVATEVVCGFLYEWRVEFSPFKVREDRSGTVQTGRLTVRKVTLYYHDTTDLTVEVTPRGRSAHTYTVDNPEPKDHWVPVSVMAKKYSLVLTSKTAGPGALNSLYWEGTFNQNRT